jgi:hypothetical protein
MVKTCKKMRQICDRDESWDCLAILVVRVMEDISFSSGVMMDRFFFEYFLTRNKPSRKSGCLFLVKTYSFFAVTKGNPGIPILIGMPGKNNQITHNKS